MAAGLLRPSPSERRRRCRGVDRLEGDLGNNPLSTRRVVLLPSLVFSLHGQTWGVAILGPREQVVVPLLSESVPSGADLPAAARLLDVHEVLAVALLLPIGRRATDKLVPSLVEAVQVVIGKALDAHGRRLGHPGEIDLASREATNLGHVLHPVP